MQGEVRVSLPYWLPYKAGEQFAVSKARWILLHRPATVPALAHGAAIGKAHRIHFEPSFKAARVSTRLHHNLVHVTHPLGLSASDTGVQEAAKRAAVRALRKEAETLLPQRLSDLAARGHYSYTSVRIKPLKSRWGSCSSRQEITLNLYLMQLPWRLIDYVLLHELAHTRVMQHGAPFWQEMERHLPAAKHLRREIGKHKPVLSPSTTSMA
jgi:predicted metal-dependent hydrolase